jgi:hypothetical protein
MSASLHRRAARAAQRFSLRTKDAVGRTSADIAADLLRKIDSAIFEVKRHSDGYSMRVWDRGFSEWARDGFAWYVLDTRMLRRLLCPRHGSRRECPRNCRQVLSDQVAEELLRLMTDPAFIESRRSVA